MGTGQPMKRRGKDGKGNKKYGDKNIGGILRGSKQKIRDKGYKKGVKNHNARQTGGVVDLSHDCFRKPFMGRPGNRRFVIRKKILFGGLFFVCTIKIYCNRSASTRRLEEKCSNPKVAFPPSRRVDADLLIIGA